jgi:L-ascorbate metabolism protein UlaG (beta-lactamase superfamily)
MPVCVLGKQILVISAYICIKLILSILFKKTYNKLLPFILPDWQGNPVNKKNHFVNLDGASERTFAEMLQWQTNRKKVKQIKKNQFTNVQVNKNDLFLQPKQDGITWLGHCTFLIHIGGKTIITDPILYNLSIIKRQTKLPCAVSALTNIDYILLSHNHRDHCDKKSMVQLCKQNPNAIVLTSLMLEPQLRYWRITNKIQEAGWYQTYAIAEDFKIHYLPAKHWARRKLHDLNRMLWGSFMIETNNKKIYFGADSGLGSHFAEIEKLFPAIDYCLLGIGAYEPNWFMHTSHTSPTDAVQAFTALGGKYMIPMHYGTFDLSDEPLQEPLEKINAMNNAAILPQVIGNKLLL